MDERDIAEELEQPGARELLTTTAMAHVAYNGADGFPRLIPVGFFWNGSEVVVCTAPTSPKVQALRDRPEVAVTIDVGDSPDTARSLTIRGTATVDVVEGVAEEYLAMSRITMEPEAAADFERNVRGMYDEQARIAITPLWARYYDFGAGRMPAFLEDLAKKAG